MSEQHDRHSCHFYRQTLTPCADCLPANEDDPKPMCLTPVLANGIPMNKFFGSKIAREKIFKLIEAERQRHESMNRGVAEDNGKWMTLFAEELGEIARGMLDGRPESEVETEAIQLAATLIALCEAIEIRKGHA